VRAWLLAILLAGCSPTVTVVSGGDPEACSLCHTNITVAHGRAVVMCSSCHGRNTGVTDDQLANAQDNFKAENPAYGSPTYQKLLDAMHVHPKDPSFFLADGASGDNGACFNNGVTKVCTGGDPLALGTVDDAIDSEYTRDVNYVRFINPGDLRVAHASCGGANPQQGDYPGASGGCHAEEVLRVRRSIMTGNSSVVTAAYMGNRGTASPFAYGDARGYMFDLDSVDKCFIGNSYDRNCLNARPRTYPADEPISPLMPENQGQGGDFDVFPGSIAALDLSGKTLAHAGFNTRLGGTGGQPLDGSNAPRAALTAPDNLGVDTVVASSLLCSVALGASVEPVGAILRGFRAYYPLWLPGTGHNFNAVAGNTLAAASTGITQSFAFNPFGRGHASGCTGCHMLYGDDGHSHEGDKDDGDQTIHLAGREPSLDLVNGAGFAQQGMNVEPDGQIAGKKQQRFYPSQHRLTSRIPTRQCGLCHTFVTRIDLAYQGIAEVEEKSTLARGDLPSGQFPQQGDITFTTPKGTKVRIIDSLERVVPAGMTFNVTSNPRYPKYYAAVLAECANRNIDCKQLAIYSADLNDNGELDDDEHFADDLTGGELWLPDRVPRDSSVDGRQVRIIYGGANGSTHLKDVHFQKGMHCVDCHFYQDLHGDGNIYTNNWDQIEIECEDCHGFGKQRAQDVMPGKLLTSGPNGRNDLMQMNNEEGQPYFFTDSDGKLHQRSRLDPNLTWEISQVADAPVMARDATNPDSNPHSDKHIPTRPGDPGKLECYTCHNTFAMNCLACHYQENFNQKVRQQKEVFLAGGVQNSHTNFQLFGMVRGPLVLAVNGNAEQHRIAPFRSTMEAYVGVADCNGDTVANYVTHSNCVAGKPIGGTSMNNFMPHSVGNQTARGCETCHTATDAQGRVVNNHILAQTMGLGTGRLNLLGDWLFVTGGGVLDVVDVKNESELGDTSKRNSFPGFVVGQDSDNSTTLVRSYSLAPSGTPAGTGSDVVLVRGFNGNLCASERPLNPDIAVVAAGSGGLQVFDVSLPDSVNPNGTTAVSQASPVQFLAGNVTGVDHAGADISDPFFYVADQTVGLEVVDLSYLSFAVGATPAAAAIPAGSVHVTGNWPAGAVAQSVKLMGSVAVVAAGTQGVVLVDVSKPTAPTVIGTPFSLCGAMSCTTSATRVTSQGTIAYVSTSDGVAAVDLADPANPKLLSVTPVGSAVEDVALSGHLAFVAAGGSGLKVLDVTVPAAPALLTQQPFIPGGGAHGVAIAAIPTQTWVFVAAGASGVHAINVSTLFDPYRGRTGQAASPVGAHASLTLESRDPLTPRDTTVAADDFPVITFATQGTATRIAKGIPLDRLVDESGRRLRDQWNPGSSVLGKDTMDKLRAVSYPYTP
jgi:hypothetical protein